MSDQEFCISCGELVDSLDDNTGWCNPCSGIRQKTDKKCVRCNTALSSFSSEYICLTCKESDWANEIEELMGRGFSYTRAKLLIAKNNQATCLSCGDIMPRATKGRHLFCANRTSCKSASRRVKHLRLNKGMSHTDALNKVLGEIHATNQVVA